MSKTLLKYEFPGEFSQLRNKVKILGKKVRASSKLTEVNTTGKSSLEIDNEVAPQLESSLSELNGAMISDPINSLLLVRQNGVWKKILAAGPWQEINLINSWEYYGEPQNIPSYRIEGDTVRMKGLLKGGATATVAFELSESYTPKHNNHLIGICAGETLGVLQAIVRNTGKVELQYNVSSLVFASLDELTFTLE